MTRPRPATIPGALTRLGFADPARALRLLSDPLVAPLIRTRERVEDAGLAAALAEVADPDLALVTVVRLMEALAGRAEDRERVVAALAAPGRDRDRMLAVLGASTALGDHLVAHPDHLDAVTGAVPLA
ncbi:MAG TPA: bifunctional glutamine-synthetase adenylyltransferase/deadenyltransferase, partial [Vicinamibacteria bacterium]|nr:bifunctional glutamine-synthetase adenylyltransferase/deadenyltransferase [Vicinamibacteria bacterium]